MRPEPWSPASATISPARTSNDTSSTCVLPTPSSASRTSPGTIAGSLSGK
ncbi:Uncharacterised protein [Mycobacteroides abscessus]|nr:Uncharacterised protein [Mycobacteroides abscessus]